MGQETQISIDTQAGDAEAAIDRIQRDAMNGDKAHNALGDGLCYVIRHEVSQEKRLASVLSELSKLCTKTRTLKAFGMEIPIDPRDVPRLAMVGGVIYIIGKMHGWFG